MCQVHTGAYTSYYSRLGKPTIPPATQRRPSRIYYALNLSLRIRTTDASQLEKRKKKEQKINERKEREESENTKDEK